MMMRWEMWDLVCRARDCERTRVEPLQEPLEDLWLFFRESDGLVEAFGESRVESCGEEWAGRC